MKQQVRADVPPATIVYATALGSNVIDVDSNRYVDLAAGFGALLLGHRHPAVVRVLGLQSERLFLALGDVHPADATVALMERLARLFPRSGARVVIGQSGADALTAALKSAVLATGKAGVVAFSGAYHGLSYGPLALCGLRQSYRAPFAEQLVQNVTFADYPTDARAADDSLGQVRVALSKGQVGAVVIEPILGRGGCLIPPEGFLAELGSLAHAHGALLIADEVWTGLGRSGKWLYSERAEFVPDLICLGKGLGGGLPISACIGAEEVMRAWRQPEEVVHTSTFAGAPLACATAIATLDTLGREHLVERSAELGQRWLMQLERAVSSVRSVRAIRGAGLMVGIELAGGPQIAATAQRRLLERGYIVSTGGGERETLVFTPALTVGRQQLEDFVEALVEVLQTLPA